MTAITNYPSQVSASEERGAIFNQYVAGETITLGDAVYLDSSNVAWKAKADSSAHANAIGLAVIPDNFYGETTIKVNGTVGVVVYGPVWGWVGLVPGEQLWIDKTTGGALNDTAPTGGAYQFVLGRAIDAETIFVDPGTSTPASHS